MPAANGDAQRPTDRKESKVNHATHTHTHTDTVVSLPLAYFKSLRLWQKFCHSRCLAKYSNK